MYMSLQAVRHFLNFHHPRFPLTLPHLRLGLYGRELDDSLADVTPTFFQKQVYTFLSTRLNDLIHVRYAMSKSHDKQQKLTLLTVRVHRLR